MAEPSGSSELAGGPAVVRTIQLAAELTTLTARVIGRADLAKRARTIREQAAPLAAEDAAAYQEFLRTRSDVARDRTIELPLLMADLAAQIADVAAEAAEATEGAVGGDARVGAILADAAARAAALLVRVNGGGDGAAGATARAARAAARV